MFCIKCGNQIEDNSVFCNKCGTKVKEETPTPSVEEKSAVPGPVLMTPDVPEPTLEPVNPEPVVAPAAPEPVQPNPTVMNNVQPAPVVQQPVYNQPQKKNSATPIIIVVVALLLLFGVGIGINAVFKNLSIDGGSGSKTNVFNKAKSSTLIDNTRWYSNDNSELVFDGLTMYWYEDPKNYYDNFLFGRYDFYIGSDAVKHVVYEMTEYGVTEEELQKVFTKNKDYNESNFVVIDIKYDYMKVDGEEKDLKGTPSPWYGFILMNNTYLDLVDMKSGNYYSFTKK